MQTSVTVVGLWFAAACSGTLAKEPGVAGAVAAFITVAGASGGSPIADVLPAQADKWIQMFKMGGCKGDLAAGFKSLRKSVRRAAGAKPYADLA